MRPSRLRKAARAVIAANGAVSRDVASALATGIRGETGATYGVGITGIAGPSGGTDEKPIGLVYIAVSDGVETDVEEKRFQGDRDRIRPHASQAALDLVR